MRTLPLIIWSDFPHESIKCMRRLYEGRWETAPPRAHIMAPFITTVPRYSPVRFPLLHLEMVAQCRVSIEKAHKLGQRAFIGKVSMDRNSPDNYMYVHAEQCSYPAHILVLLLFLFIILLFYFYC